MKTISNEKFLSRASNKMDIASDDANLVPKASQEAGERKVVIAVDKESYGGEEATHDNVPNVNKSDPEQNKNIKMEQEEKITLTEDTEIAYNKQILEDNAVEEIPVSETKPCESVTECTAISSKEKDPNISEAAVSSTMMLAQSKDISESTETVAVTITNGEEVAKAPEVDVVITADKGECVDKLNDKCQENAEGGQELLENLDRVEKDTDVAAKEDVNELRKTAYVIEKKDVVIKDQPVESNIAIESEKIVEIDKPASEQISNTVIIEDALQKVEVENTQKREGNIENTQKEEPFIEEIPVSKDNELSKDEENKKFERNLACENTLIDSRECGKLNDSTITETDEKKSQAKPIPIQVSNEPLIAEVLKEAGNGENIANTSAHDTLENIDKKTEAPKDSSGAIATDVTNPNEDSVPKSSAVVDVQDEIKCTVDKRPSNPIEKLVKSIDKITEIIEIDDDDEEMLAKNQNNKIDEDMSKDEASNATVSEKENQMIHCVENKINNSENNAVAKTCASMHTMPVIFYNKECINFECSKNHKEFHRAPQFAMNYFKVVKKKIKIQYICGECYDMALNFYQGLCGMINAKQPILLRDIASKKQEFVEILDSSDEEDNSANDTENMEKENTSFSKTDLILIETELENAIRNTFNRVEIQKQLTWSKTIFTERVQKMQEELEYIDEELREKQNLADKMYNNLYESGKYRISTLKPIDLDNENTENNIQQVPPYGEIIRPPIKLGDMYYAAKHKAIACWIPCRAVEPLDVTQVGSQKNVPNFKVKFINTQYQTYKNLSAKLIAYYDPPSVRLSVGQRVIAFFDGTTLSRDKDKCTVQSAFYPGIIAEEMKPNNFFRYLIFYDDGYTQYVSHKHVRLVCHVARNVWEDVDQSSREFIQKYIMEYRVNRPMVQTHKGQKMATESNGRWVPARVIDIDCSLVRMQFEGPNKNHKEWIYRGSLRLNPVYMEYQKSKSNQATQLPISRLPRRTEPFIRYTEDEENIGGSLGLQQRGVNRSDTLSSAKQSPKVRHLNANTIYLEDENRPKGKVIYYTAKRQLPTKTYRPHKCGPDCLIVVPHNLNGYSPLAKPLLSGWERIFLRQKAKKRVFYRAPCGKCFRDMTEVHQYLRLTKNTLNVDSFDFYPETSCLAEFEAENINLRKRDISKGQEKMPLPLVNYYDDSLPECTYSAKVIPTEGVNINTNPDFLICCDCEDDCVDKEKCACWQLTIEGVRSINPEVHIDDIGYQYKRLYEHLPTGIYECNSRCKCKSHCINRVVQHSLEMKLQVFKTSNRGWGLRCLNDIPRGSFVCIYAGNLLTESKANEGGLDAGDEYFAELDYIETVEQLKEGYESDVETQEDEEDEEPYLPDDDDEFRPGKSFLSRSKRSQRQSSGEGERQAINFNPNAVIQDDTKKKRPSVRQFFGKDEAVYVMDAKVTGNLGRYFNHSCSPNLFVQNVFVDTHDVRFPWVAFFSLVHIRAGTELTWNYNYEVGVVPGKVLYCQCGAPNCRQRLL